MTRFEKWISKQDRFKIVCEKSVCKDCILSPVCASSSDWGEECEAYLDEEVDDEESTKRTD